jgi:transcriptional regulator with XRE-family HTH domain
VTVRLSHDLYTLRQRQGWSLEALARVAGTDPDTVLALEQTRTDPQLSTIVRLLYPFGYELQLGYRPTRQRAGFNRVELIDPSKN